MEMSTYFMFSSLASGLSFCFTMGSYTVMDVHFGQNFILCLQFLETLHMASWGCSALSICIRYGSTHNETILFSG